MIAYPDPKILYQKKTKKKLKYPDCYKKFPSKRGFLVCYFAKDQKSTTEFHTTLGQISASSFGFCSCWFPGPDLRSISGRRLFLC